MTEPESPDVTRELLTAWRDTITAALDGKTDPGPVPPDSDWPYQSFHPMLVDLSGITPRIARNVLAHFGDRAGHRAGGFITALIALIARADVQNRARLYSVYPEYTAAVLLAQLREDGMAQLRTIAASDAEQVS